MLSSVEGTDDILDDGGGKSWSAQQDQSRPDKRSGTCNSLRTTPIFAVIFLRHEINLRLAAQGTLARSTDNHSKYASLA